jgi:hypothetical protein
MYLVTKNKIIPFLFIFLLGVSLLKSLGAGDSDSLRLLKNYYILMQDDIPKDESLGYNQFIHVGLKLNHFGKFQNSIPSNRKVSKILITAGSSKPNHWNQVSFQKNFKESILDLKKKNQLNEIQLDFEGFSSKDKRQFSDMVCSMKKFANGEEIQLSLAVFPPNHLDNKGFHDWSLLHICADKLYVMMYDMHNPRTGPGQVTNSKWIEDNLTLMYKMTGESEKALNSKLILGLPLYGYSWNRSGKFLRAYPNRRIKAVEEADMDGLVWSRSKNETVYMPSNIFLRHWEGEAKKRKMHGIIYWRWGY